MRYLLLTLLAALFRPIQDTSPDHVLSPDVRAAMSWADRTMPASATFVVVTGEGWDLDAVGEWFPALAKRSSVATVQGYEWMGTPRLWLQHDLNADLQACATATDTCLVAWMRRYDLTAPYVFLPKGPLAGPLSATDCCSALRDTLRTAPGDTVVYDADGATIIRLRGP